MKIIYKIAKTELQVLFYSPVAWLILIIFAFVSGGIFAGAFDGWVNIQEVYHSKLNSATVRTFSGFFGVYSKMQSYLYMFIPLLTMGIMSRDLGSGSIKLLYSSPITNAQIILGKYLSLMIFGLVLTGILLLYGIFAMVTIDHVDIPFILTGWLGLYLLLCAYAAIGLFMSSLTTYNVVAALGTFSIFALLAYVKGVGQDMAFVRDVTYWMAITGRSDSFIAGMITTEDVLYFFIVSALFLSFTIIKLQAGRVRSSRLATLGKYLGVFLGAVLLGYFSSLPGLKGYYDATRTKENTLTPASQAVMAKLTGKFTIHTYVNMLDQSCYSGLPASYKSDVSVFEKYIRFKPDIQMDYIYYYQGGSEVHNPMVERMYAKLPYKQQIDSLRKLNKWKFDIAPYSAISKQVNLEPEHFRFVRVLERENGQKTFLRYYDDFMHQPSESEISAAIKRLVMKLPVVGFVRGHGERGSDVKNDRGYSMLAQEKGFRYAMINQGFDFTDITLDKPIPDSIRIVVLAEIKQALTPQEQANLDQYIARGGNLMIAGEPGRQAQMNPAVAQLGVQFLPGTLVKPDPKFQPDLMVMKPTKEAAAFSFHLEQMRNREFVLTMPSACGLSFNKDKGFEATTLFRTDSTGSWNETETTNLVDDSARYNPAAGETMQSYPTAMALSRKINGKTQKIIVTGDADWMSNGEMGMQRNELQASNFTLVIGSFFWLSDGEVPIDMHRPTPPDQSVSIRMKAWSFFNVFFNWILPALLLATSLVIWIRRRGR